jgi:hypothetical protein
MVGTAHPTSLRLYVSQSKIQNPKLALSGAEVSKIQNPSPREEFIHIIGAEMGTFGLKHEVISIGDGN